MDLLAIISGISAIASLLSIFFDVGKIPINLKKFMLLLSVVCLVVFSITAISSKKNNEDNQVSNLTGDLGSDLNSEEQNVEEGNSSSESETSTDIYINESEETHEEITNSQEKIDSDNGIYEIDPISSNIYNAVAIEDSHFEIQPNEIIGFSGEVSSDGQSNDYEYIPPLSGTYRFEFSNVPNGTDFRLRIYNSGWEQIEVNSDLDNGDGITKSLTAGEKYYIRVEQYRAYGAYTLNVGQKKETIDITNYTAVSDSIQYTNQENDYLYVAKNDGTYRFEFSNVPNGTDLRLRIYNSGWEQIEVNSDLDNGDGITKFLTAGEIYYIRVEQYREIGAYTLNIGSQKEIVDLSNYTAVSDSIQYTSQTNDYSYVAETDGAYRFEFSNVPNGTDLRLRIYNSGWEQIEVNSDLDNGDGITESLVAGEKYYIRVEQYREYGSYTLNIGKKKEIIDITNYTAVSDSIQYTDQENDYLFTAKAEGTYRFIFSNVSEGNSFRLGVFNSGWEKLESNSNLGNGGELKVSLLAGESYFIKVTQYSGSGNYILTTERQLE